ncbi:hypothetical protein PPERSA_07496 [Pseudocohnilembus persalinus]|uniref:RING-type domain-containing protein n=1 Tax=Pseudocohnilembus persalinus TaxID=266149 RepID=A0A0V0QZP1_PSEPJ|nr:hypothetical protein PPERSA_07496 [Pseudocohnilembus persalinus]|eukprot:KRX07746.1 hypothetical protein PPERSA_07496 [Pseudocohnilembus persalinus]
MNDEKNQKNVEIGEIEYINKQQTTKQFNDYLEEEEEGKIQSSKSSKQIEDIEICVKNDTINSLNNIGKTRYSELSIQNVVWEIAQQYNEVLIIKEYEFSDEANNNHEYKTIVEQGQLPENEQCPQNQYQMDPNIEFKIDELQYKIRKQLKKKNNCIRFISLLSFFFQHIAFYFEICLVYLAYSRGELNFEDEFNLKYFLGALYMIYNIFCQLIQFHEFYLTFFGMGIFYALVLGTYCFQGFYNCIEGIMIWMNVFRFKTKKLKKFKYSDKKIEGEKICSICMNDYDSQEFVTILPCNTKHHFHYSCIIKWFKTSFTCPLCREEFLNI